jgi:hypothetical protein
MESHREVGNIKIKWMLVGVDEAPCHDAKFSR